MVREKFYAWRHAQICKIKKNRINKTKRDMQYTGNRLKYFNLLKETKILFTQVTGLHIIFI